MMQSFQNWKVQQNKTMKKLILILGLLLAGGTARAVPSVDFSFVQDDWVLTWTYEVHDWPVDGTGRTLTWDGIETPSSFNLEPTQFDWLVGENRISTIGDHTALFTIFTPSETYEFPFNYTVIAPTGPKPTPAPDGGATALLLGLGLVGLVVHRRLQPAR